MELKGIRSALGEIKEARAALIAAATKASNISLNFQREFSKAWRENSSLLVISEEGINKISDIEEDLSEELTSRDMMEVLADIKENFPMTSYDHKTNRKTLLCLSGISADSFLSLSCTDESIAHVSCSLRIPGFNISCSTMVIYLESGVAEYSENNRRKKLLIPAAYLPMLINKGIVEEYGTLEDIILKYNV